jgi:ketosteroid isomerase-like protein
MVKSRKLLGTIEDIEMAYYDALARADIEALMSLWADDEEIVCVHPGTPRLVGHAAIRESWEAIFERGGVYIQPVQLHATQNPMMAVHSVIEKITRSVNQLQDDLHVIATNVYLKTPMGWRIVTHHASIAPGKAPQEVITPSTVLH